MMIKKEVNAINLDTQELPKKARGIQFCTNLRTAYEHAVMQTSFCHALADATNDEVEYKGVKFYLRYTASMTPEEIGSFATESEGRRAMFADSFLDERDGKNWDANVQRAHRWALAGWYGKFSPELQKMALEQIKVTGRYANGPVLVKYSIDGTVKSGHWDTSSGNGALNIEITAQAIAGLSQALRPREVRGLAMGDDLLLWLYFDHPVDPRSYYQEINEREAKLGIHPVRGLFRDVLHVSFCSMGFYWTDRAQLVALPKVGRCFAKLFWTVTPLRNRCPARLASTVAHAFLPAYHTYKPMRAFLKHHTAVAPLEVDIRDQMPYVLREHALPRTTGVLWDEAHVVKYGLTPCSLDNMAEVLAACPVGIVSHPAVSRMLAEDTCDPPERRGCLTANI